MCNRLCYKCGHTNGHRAYTLLHRLLSIRFKSLKPSTVQANSKFGQVQTSSDMSTGDYDYNDTSTAYTGTVVDYDLEDRIVRINDMSLMNDPEDVLRLGWANKDLRLF